VIRPCASRASSPGYQKILIRTDPTKDAPEGLGEVDALDLASSDDDSTKEHLIQALPRRLVCGFVSLVAAAQDAHGLFDQRSRVFQFLHIDVDSFLDRGDLALDPSLLFL